MVGKKQKAFSLPELMLSVLIAGILAAVCIPRLNFSIITKSKTEATALMIVADLRRTRSLAISRAATNTSGFALNMQGSSPYRSYQIVDLSDNSVVDTLNIDQLVTCTGTSGFHFGPLGNLTSDNGDLTVSTEDKTFTISIIPATGIVECTED